MFVVYLGAQVFLVIWEKSASFLWVLEELKITSTCDTRRTSRLVKNYFLIKYITFVCETCPKPAITYARIMCPRSCLWNGRRSVDKNKMTPLSVNIHVVLLKKNTAKTMRLVVHSLIHIYTFTKEMRRSMSTLPPATAWSIKEIWFETCKRQTRTPNLFIVLECFIKSGERQKSFRLSNWTWKQSKLLALRDVTMRLTMPMLLE